MADLYQHRILSRRSPYTLGHPRTTGILALCITSDKGGITGGWNDPDDGQGPGDDPKAARDYLSLTPGSEVEFVVTGEGQVALKTKARRPKGRFEALRGTLDLSMTTDEFMRFLRGDPDE